MTKHKTITNSDEILTHLKKLYHSDDTPIIQTSNTQYQIRIADQKAEQFKKHLIKTHDLNAKQITIDKVRRDPYFWFEHDDDGTAHIGYYHWIIINDLNKLKVKNS